MPFWDRTLDLAILTHPDVDHVDAQAEVPTRMAVDAAWETVAGQANADASHWRERTADVGVELVHAGGWADLGDAAARGERSAHAAANDLDGSVRRCDRSPRSGPGSVQWRDPACVPTGGRKRSPGNVTAMNGTPIKRAPEVAALFLEASRVALAITAIDTAAQYAEHALTWAAAPSTRTDAGAARPSCATWIARCLSLWAKLAAHRKDPVHRPCKRCCRHRRRRMDRCNWRLSPANCAA